MPVNGFFSKKHFFHSLELLPFLSYNRHMKTEENIQKDRSPMTFSDTIKNDLRNIQLKSALILLCGAGIVAFGMYNIHDVANITEGGILGLDLLLDHWFHISPSVSNFILTALCFFIGWKVLGKKFILHSAIATGAFSLFYRLLEFTPKCFPEIAAMPLFASVAGALFVGIGVGLTVSEEGAQSGDDALAMVLNHHFGWKISTIYLVSDLFVLTLSLTYIPLNRILYSLVTVVLSGQIIEFVVWLRQKIGHSEKE